MPCIHMMPSWELRKGIDQPLETLWEIAVGLSSMACVVLGGTCPLALWLTLLFCLSRKVNAVAQKQLGRLWHTSAVFFHPPIHEYAEKLSALLPEPLKVWCFQFKGIGVSWSISTGVHGLLEWYLHQWVHWIAEHAVYVISSFGQSDKHA